MERLGILPSKMENDMQHALQAERLKLVSA